jgi:hypothetical protein
VLLAEVNFYRGANAPLKAEIVLRAFQRAWLLTLGESPENYPKLRLKICQGLLKRLDQNFGIF